MKPSLLRYLVCPACAAELEMRGEVFRAAEIVEARLVCRGCGHAYPVLRGVPRFVEVGDYASSFGYQWNRFKTVQLDSSNGSRESETALYASTGWTQDDYRGRLVLDAGVGAGRFAEVVARMGGEVIGVDLTSAIDAAYENIGMRD